VILNSCAQKYRYNPELGRAASIQEWEDSTRAYGKRKGWNDEIINTIINHQVKIGMIKEQVKLSIGEPDGTKSGESEKGDIDIWAFSDPGSEFKSVWHHLGRGYDKYQATEIFVNTYYAEKYFDHLHPKLYLYFRNDSLVAWQQ
jgi:hypothetical protein